VVAFYKSVCSSNAVRPSYTEAKLDVFDKTALDFRVDHW